MTTPQSRTSEALSLCMTGQDHGTAYRYVLDGAHVCVKCLFIAAHFKGEARSERTAIWIPVSERVPGSNDGPYQGLLISDANVAIENFETVGHLDVHGQWWAGLPGNWIPLRENRWTVTHWRRLVPHGER